MSRECYRKCPGVSGNCPENVLIFHDLGQKLMSGMLLIQKIPDIKNSGHILYK
jgi:hypothetical protein